MMRSRPQSTGATAKQHTFENTQTFRSLCFLSPA